MRLEHAQEPNAGSEDANETDGENDDSGEEPTQDERRTVGWQLVVEAYRVEPHGFRISSLRWEVAP